jgi:hypothetical protein
VRVFLDWLSAGGPGWDADPLSDRLARDHAARDFRRWLKVERRAAASTVNLALASLDALYRQRGLGNPNVRREKPLRAAPRALEQDAQRQLLRACERASARDRALGWSLDGRHLTLTLTKPLKPPRTPARVSCGDDASYEPGVFPPESVWADVVSARVGLRRDVRSIRVTFSRDISRRVNRCVLVVGGSFRGRAIDTAMRLVRGHRPGCRPGRHERVIARSGEVRIMDDVPCAVELRGDDPRSNGQAVTSVAVRSGVVGVVVVERRAVRSCSTATASLARSE